MRCSICERVFCCTTAQNFGFIRAAVNYCTLFRSSHCRVCDLRRKPSHAHLQVYAIHITHKDLAIAMLKGGKHVLSEKPIAVSTSTCCARALTWEGAQQQLDLSHVFAHAWLADTSCFWPYDLTTRHAVAAQHGTAAECSAHMLMMCELYT